LAPSARQTRISVARSQQSLAARSISGQRAPITSPVRAAVRIRNSRARAQAAQDNANAILAQDEHAGLIEQTVLQAVADVIDFLTADSFEAAARDAA
jgi:hypothetical protein